MPGSLIAKTILPHMIYVFAAFFFFIARGRGADFIKAKWHALKGVKRALQKRWRIQFGFVRALQITRTMVIQLCPG
jgi:hypothetical protein